jgi:hypothetical protein
MNTGNAHSQPTRTSTSTAPAPVVVPEGLAVDGTTIVHTASGVPLQLDVYHVEVLATALHRLAQVNWTAIDAPDTPAGIDALHWTQRLIDGEVTAWLSEREQVVGTTAYERGLCPFCLLPDHGQPGVGPCEMLDVDTAEAALGLTAAAPRSADPTEVRR